MWIYQNGFSTSMINKRTNDTHKETFISRNRQKRKERKKETHTTQNSPFFLLLPLDKSPIVYSNLVTLFSLSSTPKKNLSSPLYFQRPILININAPHQQATLLFFLYFKNKTQVDTSISVEKMLREYLPQGQFLAWHAHKKTVLRMALGSPNDSIAGSLGWLGMFGATFLFLSPISGSHFL